MEKMKNNFTKKSYSKPLLNRVLLDNQIVLFMASNPPENPDKILPQPDQKDITIPMPTE